MDYLNDTRGVNENVNVQKIVFLLFVCIVIVYAHYCGSNREIITTEVISDLLN